MSGSNGDWYTPPGWYDDGQGSIRWWDGRQWTQEVDDPEAPRGSLPEPPAPPAIPPPPPGSQELRSYPASDVGPAIDASTVPSAPPGANRPTPRRGKVPLVIAGGVAVAAVIAVIATLTTRDEPTPDPWGAGVMCWDGSEADSTFECPAFEGEAALRHAFTLANSPAGDAAMCESMEPASFTPAGARAVLSCVWSDLPGLTVYLASYTTTDAAQSAWNTYYASAEPFDWIVADQRVGSGWTGQGIAPSGEPYWSTGTLYDDLPLGIEYAAESPLASSASIDAAWARVTSLTAASIAELVGQV